MIKKRSKKFGQIVKYGLGSGQHVRAKNWNNLFPSGGEKPLPRPLCKLGALGKSVNPAVLSEEMSCQLQFNEDDHFDMTSHNSSVWLPVECLTNNKNCLASFLFMI